MTPTRADGSAAEVDVVVLGLGPGGEYAANKLAAAGLRVVAIEQHLVGGECPFVGCIPSKLMIRSADVLAEARRAAVLGGEVTVRPDFGLPVARIREATREWSDDSHVARLEKAGVRIVRGRGRLDGPGRVVLADGRAWTAARSVILNTGTSPAVPPIEGLAGTPYLTNREVFRLTEAPGSLAVIGGGPIGCELAQAFARFGSAVTVVEVADRLLSGEEPESGSLLADVFSGEGLDVRVGADVSAVGYDAGRFSVTLADGKVDAEQLLVATGRRTNLSGLGLETVGLEPEAKLVETDERMRAAERLHAVGDITGRGAFTHVSLYQAAVVVRDILGEDGPWADYRAVTRVTFTDPEVASVGLTEAQARERGLPVSTAKADLPRSSRGFLHDLGNDGLVKLVADTDRGVLVGATAVGPSGGEVLGLLAAAVHAEIPVATLRGMHFAYPTFHRAVEVALKGL